MRTLEPADYEIIEAIVKAQLKHYNLIEAPKIEEQIYVRCVDNEDGLNFITVGKEYAVEKEEEPYYWVWNDKNELTFYLKKYFTTAQQEPNESNGERYQVFTYDTDNGFEVLVLGIKEFENAKKIKDAIQQLLKTL